MPTSQRTHGKRCRETNLKGKSRLRNLTAMRRELVALTLTLTTVAFPIFSDVMHLSIRQRTGWHDVGSRVTPTPRLDSSSRFATTPVCHIPRANRLACMWMMDATYGYAGYVTRLRQIRLRRLCQTWLLHMVMSNLVTPATDERMEGQADRHYSEYISHIQKNSRAGNAVSVVRFGVFTGLFTGGLLV